MDDRNKILKIIENSANGIVTSAEVTEAGVHRSALQECVREGKLQRFGRGLYIDSGKWEDDLYMLQLKYGRGIFSHGTALYLHGYSDRTPIKYTMTFPKGYNTPSIKNENVDVKRVIDENYNLGIVELKSPCGNNIRVYDLERSLCDILRGNDGDIQIIVGAMKRYARSKERDVYRLMKYAEQLRVRPKVSRYMEILL